MGKQTDLIKRWREISISLSHRPILVLLFLIIGWILCFYDPPERERPPDESGVRLTAVVKEISGSGEDTVLTVSDVQWPDGRAGDASILLYPAKTKNNSLDNGSFFNCRIGQTIRLYGDIRSFQKPGNPGQFNEAAYYYSQGIDARMFVSSVSVVNNDVDHVAMFLQSVRGFFRDAFYRALPAKEAGILSAMVLGDKSGLSEDIRDLYRENGLAHILAISGLHISLIGMGLFELLKRFVFPLNVSALTTGLVLLLYGQLTGFSLSTRRAVIMTMLVLLARILGERYDAVNALSLAAVIELLLHPSALYQSGFLLSYGTVAGILLFVRGWEEIQVGQKGLQVVYDLLKGSLGITLVTLPIMVQSYHEIATYAVPVNALLLPAMSLLLGMALVGGVTSILGGLYRFCFGPVYVILWCYQQVCEWVALLPGAVYIIGHRSFISVIIYYAILVISLIVRKKKYLPVLLWGINIVLFFVPVTTDGFWPSFRLNDLAITNLDVGQGDCCCIRFVDGHCVLIDGGSTDVKQVGKYRIVPFLKYYGVDTVDYMIITHSDEDHISGFREILEKDSNFGLSIRHVVMPEIQNKDDNYKEFEALAGEKVMYIRAGDAIQLGDARFTCLHPSRGYVWEDANDYSTVLELEYGDFKGLFTGDLGFHGEEAMVRETACIQQEIPDVDYLKVGHHGSKTSSSEAFLSRVKPEIAVASAGVNNRYHHPAAEAVERLKSAGAVFYCTAESGAVTVRTDGHRINVGEFVDGS